MSNVKRAEAVFEVARDYDMPYAEVAARLLTARWEAEARHDDFVAHSLAWHAAIAALWAETEREAVL